MPSVPTDWTVALSQPGTVLLDTARPDDFRGRADGASLLFTNPRRLITATTLAEVADALAALDAAVAEGHHVAGFMSYEASFAWLPHLLPPAPTALPLVWFGVYDEPRRLSDAAVRETLPASAAIGLTRPEFGYAPAGYSDCIDAIKTLIAEGEVYQINLTGPFTFTLEDTPQALFAALRQKQRVAYGAWIQTDDATLLSFSPELFWGRNGDRVFTRPMKGTVRRGRTLAEDAVLRDWLARDEKSRAENLMIVDLLRNDLSICCEPGSVHVPALFTVETYETLFQMTSTVEGRLRPETTYTDLFHALFPCGSVTGAPKLRAMQHIAALEEHSRGVYCGAIGYIAPDATARFSVAIRTAVLQRGADEGSTTWQGSMGVGSGIVWDSQAADEYAECLLKAQFLTATTRPSEPFRLIETMCWEDGIRLLDRHLSRLSDSATYFGFQHDIEAIHQMIAKAVENLPAGTRHKVRLTLGPDGVAELTVTPLPPEDTSRPLQLTLALERIDSENLFFYHKTTRRTTYEAAYEAARAAGYDEAVLLNERGECCEGTRSNLFIKRKDGMFLTPPVSAGLLRGVYRDHLLATLPRVEERTLYLRDLLNCEALYVCNAVWGVRQAVLTPTSVLAEPEQPLPTA